MAEALLEMKDIWKSFGGTRALKGVSIDIGQGEVMALLGENGAGKSTLINILGGIVQPDRGMILIDGQAVGPFPDVQAARHHKVAVIHQEIVLVPHLSVAENVFLGRELTTRIGVRDVKRMLRRTQEAIAALDLDLDAEEEVGQLSTAKQQLVEILKAVFEDARILVMDEPTSSLSEPEVTRLFSIVRRLKSQGAAIIYISHRIDEIFEISDRVTILRDGTYVGTRTTAATTPHDLVSLMVGRDISAVYERSPCATSEILLSVEGLSQRGHFEDVSFTLRKGEVLGFAGLIGSGRTEIMTSLFGASSRDAGRVVLNGRDVNFKSVQEAVRSGLAMVPEDRKGAGLVFTNTVGFNLALAATPELGRGPFVDPEAKRSLVDRLVSSLRIKAGSSEAEIGSLSGGNQQKVVVGKWLATTPQVLILDEPTRGVDIGARQEIYGIIDRLAKDGMGVIVVSSDLPEILGLCDRVCVVREGRLVSTLDGDGLSQETIMRHAAGAAHAEGGAKR